MSFSQLAYFTTCLKSFTFFLVPEYETGLHSARALVVLDNQAENC